MLTFTRRLSLGISSAISLALGACGGGGGGETSFIPPPPPTPPPVTPPPQTPAQIFPAITATTNFAAISMQVTNMSPPTLTADGVSVRYDASTGLYVMGFPGASASPFSLFTNYTPSDTWWYGQTLGASSVNILKPSNPELQLSYTTLANYDTGGMGGGQFGWMAFGTATPGGAVPTAGSATYTALVRGSSSDQSMSLQGSATLAFDFAAGTLAGHLDPVQYDLLLFGSFGQSLGRYDFVNTVYSAGSTNFSGKLSNPAVTGTGSFSGQFMGPAAQELMARWSAPYQASGAASTQTLFGVLVGKRP